MSKVFVRHGLVWSVLLGFALALFPPGASAGPRPGVARRTLNLFSGILGRQNVNRFDCGLDAFGKVCVDPNGSTTVGGGFWPKGTPDQYVFNSGLQLAGIVNPAISGFAWAGDTVGALFFDPKGSTEHGDKLSLVWSSLDNTDNANWPRDAYVPDDTSLFAPVLIGRKAASQQDTWIRYWDGNPAVNAGRYHPLGVLVNQRGMAWNFPTGNQDIIYYLYTFTNITSKDPATYAGRPDADSLAILGARFQSLNEAAFGVQIPDSGYTMTNMYAAFAMDADVSDAARENYSTAFLPFDMGTAFKSNWFSSSFKYPPSIFGAPFAAAPGFVGVKYLKSPINPATGEEVGLTMFSNTINGGVFDDAQNTVQLWRYLSAKLDPSQGDAPCSVPNPAVTHYCYVTQNADDIRFFQSSGPFNLEPGQEATIVVAYITAAPYDIPEIANRAQGFDLKPGLPATPGGLATGDTLRTVDKIMGALNFSDANGDTVISQDEVQTVPRSLLNKALVAQAVFDAHFLLPFPPDAPPFYLVPGDNQVTVVWQESPTEQIGDPYFAVASDPTSAIYDANYREFDVEGYRVYRGRTSGDVTLLAQFDKAGTEIIDYTAALQYGNCAPELGLTTDCPADLASGHHIPLSGSVVQIPPGGRVQLASGAVLVLSADTAVTGGASGNPGLTDTGIPFAFIDNTVKNSFTYYYTVTAFDVNSVASVGVGSTSLESSRVVKSVVPRKPGNNAGTPVGAITTQLVGADGQALTGSAPTIDAATGTFSGPAAPTGAFTSLGVSVFADQLLGTNAVSDIRIDSVVPSYYHQATYFVSGLGPVTIPAQFTSGTDGAPLGEEDGTFDMGPAKSVIPADSSLAKQQGLGPVPLAAEADAQITLHAVTFDSKNADWHPVVDGSFFEATGITDDGGSRWFDGANETMANPTLGLAHGQLTGVTTIYRPTPYNSADALMRRFDQTTYHLFRAADIKVYWGSTPGTVDSVVDVTHHVPVLFSPQNRASYGFLRDVAGTNVTAPSAPDGVLTYHDFLTGGCLPANPTIGQTGCETRNYATTAALLPADIDGDDVADGNGFGMYLNGEPFIFAVTALPSNTVWTYRSYTGDVKLTGGTYTFTQKPSNAPIPGLRLEFKTTTPAVVDPSIAADLSQVHTVPDPYYVTNAFEQSSNNKVLRFVNLPSQCIVRIYSLSGVLVQVLTLNDPAGGGELTWNLRNRNQQFVASGVYFYHVEAPDGKQKIGRFTVVNYAQ
jgi:hypothetical protein